MFALDPDHPKDVADVLESAGLLEVSEYRVFELAYAAWFSTAGEAPDKKMFERAFFAYLYCDRVPPWVRAYTREIVQRADACTFDPADYGITYAPPTPTMTATSTFRTHPSRSTTSFSADRRPRSRSPRSAATRRRTRSAAGPERDRPHCGAAFSVPFHDTTAENSPLGVFESEDVECVAFVSSWVG